MFVARSAHEGLIRATLAPRRRRRPKIANQLGRNRSPLSLLSSPVHLLSLKVFLGLRAEGPLRESSLRLAGILLSPHAITDPRRDTVTAERSSLGRFWRFTMTDCCSYCSFPLLYATVPFHCRASQPRGFNYAATFRGWRLRSNKKRRTSDTRQSRQISVNRETDFKMLLLLYEVAAGDLFFFSSCNLLFL